MDTKKDPFQNLQERMRNALADHSIRAFQELSSSTRDLMSCYRCAIMEIETKFRVLNERFSLQHDRNPIDSIQSRLKSPDSILDKMLRKKLPFTLEAIENNIFEIAGIRVSTRPDAVETDVLSLLKQSGVTAIELGAQSMDDRVLLQNGRGHTAREVESAARRIREMGFELGLQMMTGLPGDTPAGAENTLCQLLSLEPDTMRIYPTIVLEGTLLAKQYLSGTYLPQLLEEAVSLCASLLLRCEEAGVPVIRLGLHAGGDVEKGYIAGPWHPAFRELCEGEIYYQNALYALRECLPEGSKAALRVAPHCVSQMAGQHRRNLKRLKEQGFDCRIAADAGCKKYEVKAGRQI